MLAPLFYMALYLHASFISLYIFNQILYLQRFTLFIRLLLNYYIVSNSPTNVNLDATFR